MPTPYQGAGRSQPSAMLATALEKVRAGFGVELPRFVGHGFLTFQAACEAA